jgi:hypothetical protein
VAGRYGMMMGPWAPFCLVVADAVLVRGFGERQWGTLSSFS